MLLVQVVDAAELSSLSEGSDDLALHKPATMVSTARVPVSTPKDTNDPVTARCAALRKHRRMVVPLTQWHGLDYPPPLDY